ncbi:hypothetical protein AGMMS49928_08710 [Spirochaetia bacterium]|nr:hypothetical protein AGMMS49928_08710 [Spirochaetia bacterium]
MKYKAKILADRFAALFALWPGVDCVSLNEAALPDTLDPYFALILDVYYSAPIPTAAERAALYGEDTAAFETSSQESKDRFMAGNLPVRIEYKSVQKIEELVAITDTKLDSLWLIKDSGTYVFYRLAQGEILFSRNDWIQTLRKKLLNLKDEFWNQMRAAHESRMEHYLSDLGAALIQEDDFYYLISAAGFVKTACLTLFCINHRFEPSHRAYLKQVMELPVLPESFSAQLENFLRIGPEMTPERKYSLAQLIARGTVSL